MKKKKYDLNLLKEVILRDGCEIGLDSYLNINSHSKINFTCKCGYGPNTKFFQKMFEKGCFCRNCTLEISNKNRKNTCLERYNTECPLQNKKIIEKTHKTNMKKYGVLDPSFLKQFRDKIKQTCLKRYGVDNYAKSKSFSDDLKKLCFIKYGVDHYSKTQEFKDKFKKTCLEKFNTNTPIQNETIKNKIKNTCLERYGVTHPMQNKDIAEYKSKQSYKLKEFVFPCGKTIKVQGYENFALEDLIQEGFLVDEIITNRKDVPEVWYIDKDKKKHRYFADIYIPKLNKIIEVKSNWTYKIKQDIIELKADACIKLGFNFELRIYSRDNKELTIIEY